MLANSLDAKAYIIGPFNVSVVNQPRDGFKVGDTVTVIGDLPKIASCANDPDLVWGLNTYNPQIKKINNTSSVINWKSRTITSNGRVRYEGEVISIDPNNRIYRAEARITNQFDATVQEKHPSSFTGFEVDDVSGERLYYKFSEKWEIYDLYRIAGLRKYSYATVDILMAEEKPPKITFTPNSSPWTNSNVTITVSVTDTGGSGLDTWRYRQSSNNGSSYGSWTADNPSKTITLSTEGVWKIEATAKDKAGNTTKAESGSYRIDKTKPKITFTPTSSSSTTSNVKVAVSVTDTGGSGLDTWRYRLSSNNGSSYESWTADNPSKTITLSGKGKWKIQAEAKDKAGNIATVISGTYEIGEETQPPPPPPPPQGIGLDVHIIPATCYNVSESITGSLGNVRIISAGELVKVEREVRGSKYYDLPILQSNKNGIGDNPSENKRAVAVDEKGSIQYKISGDTIEILYEGLREDTPANPQNQFLSNVFLNESLPAGVTSNNNGSILKNFGSLPLIEESRRTEQRQIGIRTITEQTGWREEWRITRWETRTGYYSFWNGESMVTESYTYEQPIYEKFLIPVCGTREEPIYTIDTYVTYRIRSFEFSEDLKFESAGSKTFNNILLTYTQPLGQQRTAQILNTPAIDAFSVEIGEIRIEGRENENSKIIFTPKFNGLSGSVNLASISSSEGSGSFIGQEVSINGLTPGIKNFTVVSNYQGETIGFKTTVIVFNMSTDNVVGIKGYEKEQEIDLTGLINYNPDHLEIKIENRLYPESFSIVRIQKASERVNVLYKLKKEVFEPETVRMDVNYKPYQTNITRSREFQLVIIDLDDKSTQ